MCGIAGWVNLSLNSPPNNLADEILLRRMCDKIRHRGPDSEGILLDDSVAFGMRRLAIIDLEEGDQPVFNEDRKIAVIMNGEIYNYRELRRELEKNGHCFRGNSDTEVIPHLYEEYGEKFVEKLNGMFAVALWDERRQRLFLARDRFGVKPLYYGIFGGKLIFASELKALTQHPDVETRINFQAVRQFLAFEYIPAPLSIYQNIFKLPAAHSLSVIKGQIEIAPYWNLSFEKKILPPTVEEAAEELRRLLAEATEARLISDVPLGVLLSGGIDSASVAAFAQQFSAKPLKTFCIGFEETSFDESPFARQVAAHLGTEHHEEILSIERAAELLPEIAKWLDEPLADASILPTFLLSQFVSSEVTVALGGDGADEIFAGYPSYYAHKMAERYEKIPRFVRSNVIENIINRLPNGDKNMSFDFMAKRFVKSLESSDMIMRHHSFFGSFTLLEQVNLLTDEVRGAAAADIYSESRKWLDICDADNIIERTQYLDIKSYLAEGILTKVDRASMAVSLEVRSPFLDLRIAEFAASLPRNYKLKCDSIKFGFGKTGKYVLKKAVAPLLPASIINRRKKGFVIPVAAWLKGSLNPLIREFLAVERLEKQGIFKPLFVQKLLSEHETGKANHSQKLWTLLIFQLWIENFNSEKSDRKFLGETMKLAQY